MISLLAFPLLRRPKNVNIPAFPTVLSFSPPSSSPGPSLSSPSHPYHFPPHSLSSFSFPLPLLSSSYHTSQTSSFSTVSSHSFSISSLSSPGYLISSRLRFGSLFPFPPSLSPSRPPSFLPLSPLAAYSTFSNLPSSSLSSPSSAPPCSLLSLLTTHSLPTPLPPSSSNRSPQCSLRRFIRNPSSYNCIFLIGHKGVGKKEVGMALAYELGWDFIILKKNGRDISIPTVPSVISVPSSLVTHPSLLDTIRDRGILIWLDVEENILTMRRERERGKEGMEEIESEKMKERWCGTRSGSKVGENMEIGRDESDIIDSGIVREEEERYITPNTRRWKEREQKFEEGYDLREMISSIDSPSPVTISHRINSRLRRSLSFTSTRGWPINPALSCQLSHFQLEGKERLHDSDPSFTDMVEMGGMAPDGGLFVPKQLSPFSVGEIQRIVQCQSFVDVAIRVLERFPLFPLRPHRLKQILTRAYHPSRGFPPSVQPISLLHDDIYVVEQFKGPTGSCKDLGMAGIPLIMEEVERIENQFRVGEGKNKDKGRDTKEKQKEMKSSEETEFEEEREEKTRMTAHKGLLIVSSGNSAIAALNSFTRFLNDKKEREKENKSDPNVNTNGFSPPPLIVLYPLHRSAPSHVKEMESYCLSHPNHILLIGVKDADLDFLHSLSRSILFDSPLTSITAKSTSPSSSSSPLPFSHSTAPSPSDFPSSSPSLSSIPIHFGSLNSCSWIRIWLQIAFPFWSYAQMVHSGAIKCGEFVDVVIPAGNFGHLISAFYALEMGLPFHRIIAASNSNSIFHEWRNSSLIDLREKSSSPTLTPSLDTLIPSNLERLIHLFSKGNHCKVKSIYDDLEKEQILHLHNDSELMADIRHVLKTGKIDDERTKEVIVEIKEKTGRWMDPHTAVAVGVLQEIQKEEKSPEWSESVSCDHPVMVAATADWRKLRVKGTHPEEGEEEEDGRKNGGEMEGKNGNHNKNNPSLIHHFIAKNDREEIMNIIQRFFSRNTISMKRE